MRRLTGIAIAVMGAGTAAYPQACPHFRVNGADFGKTQLLQKYAPTLLQWVADDGEKEWRFLDYVTRIDFDEDPNSGCRPLQPRVLRDWKTTGNRKSAQDCGEQQQPAIYGDVIAVTAGHAYLLYYFYHAADRGNMATRIGSAITFGLIGAGEHENDLEGGVVVVDRLSGRAVHRVAMAHSRFDDRTLNQVRDDDVVWIEGGKHGAHLILAAQLLAPDKVVWGPSGLANRGQFVKYGGGGSPRAGMAAYPMGRLTESGWDTISGVAAPILELWPFFAGMYAEDRDGAGQRFLVEGSNMYTNAVRPEDMALRFENPAKLWLFRSMKGSQGDRAAFPWGEKNEGFERFFDPVRKLANIANAGYCQDYLYNPYLQSLLEGRLVVDSGCASFPKELNRRKQAQCK
ncbi:MAG: hypothetical protein ACRD8O_22385 [Bryobacteraceae bacterium]